MPPAERIVVIGASVGGVRALEQVVADMQPDLPAAVLIVMHLSARQRSLLPRVLAAATALPVRPAATGQILEPGTIYVAIPDHHLLVHEGKVLLTQGPKENHYRPSIDLLFRSAAYFFGNRSVGVILSGSLSDGSSGLFSIKRTGGVAIVQDPQEAPYNSMPLSALRRVDIDFAPLASGIGALVNRLARQPAPPEPMGTAAYRVRLAGDIHIAAGRPPLETAAMLTRVPSPYSCPDCNGVLFRVDEDKQDRFTCHTGHGFSASALFDGYVDSVEQKLWESIRSMQETMMLLSESAARAVAAGEDAVAGTLTKTAFDLEERLETLRVIATKQPVAEILEGDSPPAAGEAAKAG